MNHPTVPSPLRQVPYDDLIWQNTLLKIRVLLLTDACTKLKQERDDFLTMFQPWRA